MHQIAAHDMRRQPFENLIAIVDDEPSLREATESLFKSCGFEAECFASAEDFLRSGCGQRASCIVLDVRLPGMSGLELQRHLSAIDFHIPIVFMSAQFDADGTLRARAMRNGAAAFLYKPLGSHDLLAAVRLSFTCVH
jgi:FixJ family two-component response regulator